MPSPDPSRRRFLAVSGVSAALLAAGGALAWPRGTDPAPHLSRDGDARRIVRALAPSLLADALPDARRAPAEAASARDDVVHETLAGIDGLPPHARRELAQLFALLAFAPARIVLAGLGADWDDASRADVDAMLAAWRDSRLELKRAAYDALHALVAGAWYGNPRSWARIGYPGPPVVG
jgi:hypothetical protein